VKLPRSILNWEWYDHPDVSRMYIHLILKVNYAPAKWRGLEILEGEHITSISKLSIELLMSEFKVRESLTKLKNTNYIEITTTNKFTIVKLIKSRLFENEKDLNHNQIKNEPAIKLKTNQKQTTTNNNNKELIEIEKRKEFFKNEIFKFSNQFSSIHLEGFYKYWSTENMQTGRQKYEEDNNWNLEQKLKSWKVFTNVSDTIILNKNRP
jgi:hypothetical protein